MDSQRYHDDEEDSQSFKDAAEHDETKAEEIQATQRREETRTSTPIPEGKAKDGGRAMVDPGDTRPIQQKQSDGKRA